VPRLFNLRAPLFNMSKMLVFTGPESTGKSVLAAALGRALGAPVVPEFARHYLSHLNRPYGQADLETIARGQSRWIAHYRKQASEWLVVDTDWTVLQVWEAFKFRPAQFHWPKGYGAIETPYLYLLCAPDFPWAPDPLREHPESRAELFSWYQNVLLQAPCPTLVLYGSVEERLSTVLKAIRPGW